MGLFRKKKKVEPQPFETRSDLQKLYLYITVVNKGVSSPILKMFQRIGVSAQFVQMGKGTAIKQVRDILGIEDNSKEIILSFVRKDLLDKSQKELEAFFASSDKNKGIGFAIPLTSIIGINIYRFLTNTL